jgi:signal transduction histidine kinase
MSGRPGSQRTNPRLRRLQVIGWFCVMLLSLSVVFTASYFLTALIYRSTDISPAPWLSQVINSLLGLTMIGVAIGVASRVFRSRQIETQMGVFGVLIDAMSRIAKGDFSVRIDPGHRDDGPFQGVISELVKSVNNMALELDQMEALRQEFISNVSHEIQSPLTSIRGFAQALQNDRLSPAEKVHYLSIIENESTRLSRITENLLKLAALDSEHAKFDPKPFALDKQIRDLILACEPQWTGKDIDMDVALDEVTITADEDLLSQVWINLIHNSIKFTPSEGRIHVELHPRGDKVEFQICDTGIGIAAEDQARIFERFYKSDKSRERSQGGSGLGLSIAKKIVEMHKGSITVQSKLGEGSLFTVCLPTH